MSLASVLTMGYSLGGAVPGTASLVVRLGYGLSGEVPPPPPPPPPSVRPNFGGGPFWRGYCDWTKEDERELRNLEKQERDIEKRVDKAQRAAQRTPPITESSTAQEDARYQARREDEGRRIAALVTRLDAIQRAIAEKEEERDEAYFFDCVTAILMEDEE